MKRITDRGFDGGTKYRWETIAEWIIQKNWKTGVEIGVWKGQTFKYLVTNCPELTLIGIDPYIEQPENQGPEKWISGENGHKWDHETYYRDLNKFCHLNSNGKIIREFSDVAAREFLDVSLDFVFIDGDHSYKGVISDIQNWLPKIRQGGRLIGHDIHFDTVKTAVKDAFGSYQTTDDFLWYVDL